jgi:2,4-dienoyl-CoA reductase-like NADH-dependent reductase (Old Yellow Enzyme family)
VVAEDSPPARQPAAHDEIVPWIRRLTDEVHELARRMIQITHLGRRTG